MIKRSFIGLTEPKLKCDLVEPGPKEPEAIPIPSRMILLLNEPLDSTKESLIKKGDMVKKGDRLFLYKGSYEYVTAPVSGTITTIAPFTGEFGAAATYFTLETNSGKESNTDFAEYADNPDIESAAVFLQGLPGNPPLKLLADPGCRINKIVISAVDEDLVSTTRQFVMTQYRDKLSQGIELLKRLTGISDIFIALPESMSRLAAFGAMNLLQISRDYTDSLPEMIMQKHLGISPVAGKSCEDMGVCFISAEAVFALIDAYTRKEPAYEKMIGITDRHGRTTRVKAVIGTPIHRIFTQLGIEAGEKDRIIIGGPLRGTAAYTLYHPVQPDMDNIIIQAADDIPMVSNYPCINCGNCVSICPANVPVNLLVRYLEANLYQEAADSFDMLSCIECGLCSYVCRAAIPIFQYIRLGKQELMKLESELESELKSGLKSEIETEADNA